MGVAAACPVVLRASNEKKKMLERERERERERAET